MIRSKIFALEMYIAHLLPPGVLSTIYDIFETFRPYLIYLLLRQQ